MNEILKERIRKAADDLLLHEMPSYYEAFVKGAEYALSHQWISVEDALPEYDEAVIVATGHPFYSFCHRSNNHNVQTDEDGWCNYTGMKILAWMPIPQFEPKK